MSKQTDIVDNKNTAIIILCIAALFCLCGGFGYLTPTVLYPLIKANNVQKWTTVECEILESDIESRKTVGGRRRGTTYKIHIQYEYEYEGEKYHSDKYDFQNASYDDYKTAKNIINEFKPNNNCECFVNPDKPAEAVLSTKLYKPLKKSLLSFGFILFGVGFIVVAVMERRRMKRFKRGLRQYQVAPKTYSSTGVRLFYFILCLLGALAFLFVIYLQNDRPKKDISLYIFMAVLAGGAVFMVFSAMKILFHIFRFPVTVRLSSECLNVGDELTANWNIGSGAEKILSLRVGIVCKTAVPDEDSGKIIDKFSYSDYETLNDTYSIKSGSKTFLIPDNKEVREAVQMQSRWVFVFAAIVNNELKINDEYVFEVYST